VNKREHNVESKGTLRQHVTPELRRALLVDWNGPRVYYRRDISVLDLYLTSVNDVPEKRALVFGDDSLTYGELDGQANALAAELLDVGVAAGQMIPMLVGNSLGLPVAMIAMMKLGVPFVPMDESWPAKRISSILEQLKPRIVISTRALQRMVTDAGYSPLLIDDSRAPLVKPPGATVTPTSSDLIYGFYTSGSTGIPKCALNVHIGLVNRFLTMTRRFADEGRVVLQNSRHAFDSSIWQLLWPLTTGSTVIMPSRDGILDLAATIDIIDRYEVTMTDFVPSIFNTLVSMMMSHGEMTQKLQTLKRLLIGGEEISAQAVSVFRSMMPNVKITNTYGPTECSIGSVFHEMDDSEVAPIGRAIDNTVAVVLDEDRALLPPGCKGEIYIGGDCLGRGYLNDPVKTDAAFVANPFPEIPGEKLYRTGDLGWVSEDGLLFFGGRRDSQVKLAGVRIELTEVETVLKEHFAVSDAKATLVGEKDLRQLVAFVCSGDTLSSTELRDFAAARLPASSLPKRILILPHFPLTSNGKVDLLELTRRLTVADAILVSDEELSLTERKIRTIWTEVLDIGDVEVETNFFEVGGDSLTAHRLALALKIGLGHEMSVRDIFDNPTIRSQAAAVSNIPRHLGRMPVAERMLSDVALSADVRRRPTGQAGGQVLLTGATGFVGVHLLNELLAQTTGRVACLVRAPDISMATKRIVSALKYYGLYTDDKLVRVDMIRGDLASENLGLSRASFEELGNRVDIVVHCGAMVNLMLDYDAHRPANVGGTASLLRLAAEGRRKDFHHVSTLGVFRNLNAEQMRIIESEMPTSASVPESGYTQSKWVAEHLVSLGRERGINANIYRLGDIGAHSVTGIASANGVVDLFTHAIVGLRMFPNTSAALDYTPVNYVASVIVAAIIRGGSNANFHILQPAGIELREIFERLAERTNARLVPYETFWRALGTSSESDRRLQALLPQPSGDTSQDEGQISLMFGDSSSRFAWRSALEMAHEARIVLPPRESALERYVETNARRAYKPVLL
jgi:amino acid adenylation domain-containing protein/thioester reductase-like protein